MGFDLKTLEYQHILNKVNQHVYTQTASNIVMNLKPYTNYQTIKEELLKTDELSKLIMAYGKTPLVSDFDIYDILKKAKQTGFLSLEDVLMIRLYLNLEDEMRTYFQKVKEKKYYQTIEPYFELTKHHKLLETLEEYIDDKGLIKDQATKELYGIRKTIKKSLEKLNEVLSKIVTKYSTYLNENMVVLRNGRYCIGVKDTYKNKVNGIVHDISQSKQTVYIEPEDIRQITANIEHQKNLELQELNRILMIITEKILTYEETISSNLDLLTYLDFINAKATYAIKIDARMPKINQTQKIELINARHPLLDPNKVVPLNLSLDKNKPIILITGPNTGGKTVVLKTVGLLTVMMQSGLLIPANEQSNLNIYDKVFADIGDEQSIEQSLSTFSSHLVKLKQMIETLNENQLLLIDEIGTGTDPNEGTSLAIALINEIKKHQISMLVTTHYSELKQYSFEHKEIMPASMMFDHETLKPLYKLQMGISGSSNALLIAQSLGLKQSVIDDAKMLSQKYESDLTKIIERLNEEKKQLEDEKNNLEIAKEKALETQELYESELRFQKESFEKELFKIKNKEELKWKKLQEEAKNLIEELKEKDRLTQPELAKAKHQINKEVLQTKVTNTETIHPGDTVLIKSYGQTGTVKQIKNKKYLVTFGQFELEFSKNDLELERKKEIKKEIKPKKSFSGTTPNKNASLELDLRGFRYEDVAEAMEQAMDRAYLANMPYLRVIHGFGTGAVRKAVYEYLKTSPYVSSYRYGQEGEGLNGVTVVTLK